ncbi:hypothetical protein D3C72_1312580 [compost metagenome]
MAGDKRRQLAQRAGQYVGHHHVGLDVLRLVGRQIELDLAGDAVALGVVMAGLDGLRIYVDADDTGGAQLQGGDAEDAGAATEVDHSLAGQIQPVQPLQAERRGGVGAGTEGQTRIQHDVDRIRVRHVAPARADPEALAELHGVEVIHPLAHPVLVLQLLDLVADVFPEDLLEEGDGGRRVGFGIEQPHHLGLAPERRFTRQWLVDGHILGIHKGHRLGSTPQQHVAHLVRGLGGGVDSNLYPGHGVDSS